MIAPHHNGSFQLPLLHQIIDRQTELCALAVAQPADSRRQTLKLDPLAREINPATQNLILRKEFEYQVVGDVNVRRLTRERHPAKRPPAFAEQPTNVSRHKSPEIVCILHPSLKRKGADIVTVVKRDRAH